MWRDACVWGDSNPWMPPRESRGSGRRVCRTAAGMQTGDLAGWKKISDIKTYFIYSTLFAHNMQHKIL